MDAATPNSRFREFNLDPALAEMVEAVPAEQMVEGILRLEDPDQIPSHFRVVSRFNRICTGRFPAGEAWTIRCHPNVVSLKAARHLGNNDVGGSLADLVFPGEIGTPAGLPALFTGRGCIVAALDFGLDFTHPNFLNPDGTTRLLSFWHQGATYDPAHPNRFGYGRVHSRGKINATLRASDPFRALGYHPAISDTGNGSHGTHTLDIAAGNGRAGGVRAGAASGADLIFIHLSTPRLGLVGDLGDSVRLLEALDFIDNTAHGRPWAANLSVGRTAGSHDGTSLVEQGMHELLRRGPGRAIVQSAGNYRSANLAVEGWIRDGEIRDLDWIIDPHDTTANEIDAWYSGKDRFVIAIRLPEGSAFVEVKLGEVADIVHEGAVIGRIYHRKNDPNNRDNHVEVFLYPGAPPGTWTVRLIGDYVISGRFHAWIERDLARPGAQSRFDRKITSQSYTLGTIATSPLVITVGAYDAGAEGTPPAPFSSCGPTRDERHDKPELLAPGVRVVAARSIPRGAVRQEGLLVALSGTSMAAPHVTGAVAAMFEAAGRPVSIDEIRDCLKRSAKPVTDGEHADCWAWGRLDTAGAIREIRGSQEARLVSAPQGDAFAHDLPVVTFEPAISDATTGDLASASEEQEIDVPLDEGALMNSDDAESFLDRAEHALRSSYGGRHESETSFLQRLLCELDGSVSLAGLSPAALFRAILHNRPSMNHARNVLEVLALPSQRPQDPLRPGDWMLRAVPGTGDVGHVSVLASGELMSRSQLRAEGIDVESSQPGYYGAVIEGGAYPHSRSEPFARRFLDSSGRVPPHTVILRPSLAGSDTADEALAPPPQRQPLVPPQLPGQPTGPLRPRQPSLPQQEIPRTVTVDLSANAVSTKAFRPERNDKSGEIELVAAVSYGSLIPVNVTFRWRSEPPDAVGFGNQALQPAQDPTNIRVPVFARRPGRARVFLEALNAQRQVIESSSITLSVPQFFVVSDSDPQLRDLARITDGRQINQPATLDSALQQLGLLNDKEQIFSMIQTAVERTAGPRAAGTSNGCIRVHNVRFIWRLSAQPDAVPNGLPAHLSTQVDLQGYPPVQLGTLFGNTAPAHPGAQNSAENPAELITVFAGMFELLTRETTTARDNTREGKDLHARLKSLGAHWRRNQNDTCLRAFMRTIFSRAVANTICHEMYHSLLTVAANERGAGGQPFDPGGHLRAPSILSINRDFNARTGVRVTDETSFPASRSYVIEEIGIGPWQTLPDVYDRRIWEFFPTPPQWPSASAAQVLREDVEEEKPPKPVPARGTFSVAALKDGGYLYRFNGEDVLSWKDRAATALTYYLTDNFPGITGPALSALVKELAPSITINSTDPQIKAANYLDLTFDAGVETTIRQRMKKQYPQFPPSRPQQGTRPLADPDKAAKAGKPPTNAPTQQPTPTPPPDKPLELNKDDQKLLDELAKVTQGAKSKTKIDPKELVRLYKLVKDAVNDPVFDQKGESLVRFAKFLQLNRDKIEGIIESGRRGNLTQDQLEKIIAEYEKFVGAEPVDKDPDKPLETVEDYNKEFQYDEAWQKLSKLDRQLLVDYARLKPEDITDKKVDFKKVPASMKVSMALKLSDKSFLGELKDAAEDAFSDPTFIITLVVMMAIYVGLWLTPDPTLITKLAAAALTVAMLLQFAWDDIIGTVRAWGDLKDDCDVSFDVAQLRQAGNKFMKKLGKTGFDILMFIVMWRVGKRVSPKLQKIGARRGVVRAEGNLATAESQPGSGKTPTAPPGSADLLGKARGAASDPSNPTSVLDALAKELSGDAQSGLAKFRQSAGDQTAMRAIESTSSQGLDVKNFLTSKGMTEAAIKAAKADVVKARVAVARAKLIEAETIKDPAMRAKARAEQFKALTEILREHGILSNAKVQKGITSRNMDDLISAIGEAIARTTIRGRAKFAGKKNFKMRTNLAVVRDFPGYKSIAEWRAAEKARANAQPKPPEPKTLEKDLSRRAAKLFEKDGKVYEGIGEIDVMMIEEVTGGKPRPVELSEIKTGQEKASQASEQIDKSIGGLADIAAKKPGVYFFELAAKNKLGKDISSAYDLSHISTIDKSTFGLQGRKGFTDSIGIGEEAIIGLAESLIRSLPPSGQTPALPPTKKEDAE